jgi:hypothetical protein
MRPIPKPMAAAGNGQIQGSKAADVRPPSLKHERHNAKRQAAKPRKARRILQYTPTQVAKLLRSV